MGLKEEKGSSDGREAALKILRIKGKDYYVQYKPLNEEELETGALIFIRSTDRIIEEKNRVIFVLLDGLNYKNSEYMGYMIALEREIRCSSSISTTLP